MELKKSLEAPIELKEEIEIEAFIDETWNL